MPPDNSPYSEAKRLNLPYLSLVIDCRHVQGPDRQGRIRLRSPVTKEQAAEARKLLNKILEGGYA